jgi:hypothetical protein
VRCRVCFDEVDPKAFVCPRCGAETDYYRSQSRLKLWARLIAFFAVFAVMGLLIWDQLSRQAAQR